MKKKSRPAGETLLHTHTSAERPPTQPRVSWRTQPKKESSFSTVLQEMLCVVIIIIIISLVEIANAWANLVS